MSFLKVCGITRVEDAEAARGLGYDAVGMVFAESPRQVTPDQARSICRSLPPSVLRVGVFVNADSDEVGILVEYCGLDLVQFHGEESPGEVARFGAKAIKALRLRGPDELAIIDNYPGVFAILLDAWDPVLRGGTGAICDWGLAAGASRRTKVVLSGGLNPSNVMRAVAEVHPFGVDVCSGVELAPGIKDHDLMRAFVHEARAGGFMIDDGEVGNAGIQA